MKYYSHSQTLLAWLRTDTKSNLVCLQMLLQKLHHFLFMPLYTADQLHMQRLYCVGILDKVNRYSAESRKPKA